MILEGKSYPTNLTGINTFRYLLFSNLYSKPEIIESLSNIISNHIECLSIDYSPDTYSFTVKIKKTVMKKYHGFTHTPDFYYTFLPAIFLEFINTHNEEVFKSLLQQYENEQAQRIMADFAFDASPLVNMCHVSCISDNVIIIKL